MRDYINFYTPYRGLLLYHGLGAGKTCASIAIAEGLKEAIESVVDRDKGINAQDVINLINFTNYTDMLKDVGSASNTIMIPHVTGAIDTLEGSFRNAMLSTQYTKPEDSPRNKPVVHTTAA